MRDPIPGDLVKKVHGDFDCDKIGVVIECETNIVGNTMLSVLVEGKMRNWWSMLVEIVDECR